MDKIYSRRRIKFFYSGEKKIRKRFEIILIIIIAIVTAVTAIRSITPIFENLCKDKAMEISTTILNEESSRVLQEYDYKDIVSVSTASESTTLLGQNVDYDFFKLTTAGGTALSVSLRDVSNAQRSINAMRTLLKAKKQQG